VAVAEQASNASKNRAASPGGNNLPANRNLPNLVSDAWVTIAASSRIWTIISLADGFFYPFLASVHKVRGIPFGNRN
jgi:hypothetical protein